MEHNWKWNLGGILIVSSVLACDPGVTAQESSELSATVNRRQEVDSEREAGGCDGEENPDQVLEWNQIFIDTLVATRTANSSSQRLGAIVHTAIFDAYNGIERRYTPIFVQNWAREGASRRAAVIAAAYTALVGLFPSQQPALIARYTESLAALTDDGEDGDRSHERGIAWGTEVAQAVLAWRATDGFIGSYPPFIGGTAIGQWRPTPPAFGPMSAQGLAFTARSSSQARPSFVLSRREL